MSESEWKILRQLHPVAIERFSRRVLEEIGRVMADTSQTSHQRFLAVSLLVRERSREMADEFDDMRRSTARLRLIAIPSHGLLTEEEFGRFRPETSEAVRSVLGVLEE